MILKSDNKIAFYPASKTPVVWLTGLSGAGKTTLGRLMANKLRAKGKVVAHIDGDLFRKILTPDLGFSRTDRDKNLKKAGQLANFLAQSGVIVIASFITPLEKQRRLLRAQIGGYIEVFCACPLDICQKRDPKGLYKRARKGQIRNMTGVNSPYEPPKNSDFVLDTSHPRPPSVAKIIATVLKRAR